MDQGRRDLTAHISGLYRYAMALVRNVPDAEDLVQECLCKAIERTRPWREIKDVRAYLFSILHNLYIDRMVKNRHRNVAVPEHVLEHKLIVPPSQQERIELRELSRALDQLSQEQRELILLVGVEGLTYEATAKVMNLPVGTVMSRLFRAREALRRLTERHGTGKRREKKAERVNGKQMDKTDGHHEDAAKIHISG